MRAEEAGGFTRSVSPPEFWVVTAEQRGPGLTLSLQLLIYIYLSRSFSPFLMSRQSRMDSSWGLAVGCTVLPQHMGGAYQDTLAQQTKWNKYEKDDFSL